MELEFDPDSVPWLDRPGADVDGYVASLGDAAPRDYDLGEHLMRFMCFGYTVFPAAVPEIAVDAYLADVDDLLGDPGPHHVHVEAGNGVRAVCDATPAELASPQLRIMDLHNSSVNGKLLALNPIVVGFLSHVLQDVPVAMQTLTFIHGTEQPLHQDFPYVVSGIPSHLVASWLALEDVAPGAGPLGYYPGSHTIAKFDWGNGLIMTPESSRDPYEFADYLKAEVERAGLAYETFLPRKGDVFLWHAALVHGGSPVTDRSLTRRSLVTHFSTKAAYRVDRRAPGGEPVVFEINGGLVFANPLNRAEEDRFGPRPTPLDGGEHLFDKLRSWPWRKWGSGRKRSSTGGL